MRIRIGRRTHDLRTLVGVYARGVLAARVAAALELRRGRRVVPGRIVLFAHSIAGNLEAFARHLEREHPEAEVLLLTDRPAEAAKAARAGRKLLRVQSIRDLRRVARAEAIVSALGPIFLAPWLDRAHRPVMVDVWHGVGFKGRVAGDPALLRLDEHFVSSPFVRDYYLAQGARARVTGYARTDVLLESATRPELRERVLARFGAAADDPRRVVLFAPTWTEAGDDRERIDSLAALTALAARAERDGFLVGYRGHANTEGGMPVRSPALAELGADVFPITEELLGAVDVLVTDWSSIAIDFLPLGRPVVYLAAPAPGAALGPLTPDDRPGPVVGDAASLADAAADAVRDPQAVLAPFAEARAATIGRAWGDTLDGRSAERYWLALRELVEGGRTG